MDSKKVWEKIISDLQTKSGADRYMQDSKRYLQQHGLAESEISKFLSKVGKPKTHQELKERISTLMITRKGTF
jgi:hypothetical protein